MDILFNRKEYSLENNNYNFNRYRYHPYAMPYALVATAVATPVPPVILLVARSWFLAPANALIITVSKWR
jgi:hypothetical protein